MLTLLSFFAFALGAIVGSFLNVVIYRYPREESIVFPGSHCPHCNAAIGWYDNIPILSYIVLGARCRRCKAPISPRYPLVELANALFYLAIFLQTGPTVAFLLVAAIVSMTIALIYIDADIQILPDVIDLPGIAIGIAIAALGAMPVDAMLSTASTLRDSIIGAAAGAGVLIVIAESYKLIRRVEGMGYGDVKMLAMIGAVVGWRWLFTSVLFASIAGAAVGLAAAARSRAGLRTALPFGVFLGFALLVILFFGAILVQWLPTLRWGG
ncbi:MAG TPA: prepilin peptidase [Vicinamibacterales bacterium]|nr:prepilin peptidase [Vicinamibacterales bacterium]